MIVNILIIVSIIFSCQDSQSGSALTDSDFSNKSIQHVDEPDGNTVLTRFSTPEGYKRTDVQPDSFGSFLRDLPLKGKGESVLYYDGRRKTRAGVYLAVVDLPIGTKNLHQCADAIMRLRADYLRAQKRYDEIHFNFTNGFKADYQNWMNGNRIRVSGNNVSWYAGGQSGDNDKSYWRYLEMVFSYAGTLSLSKELKSKDISQIEIGDVFIQGGSPGHAVIVVDMAVNQKGENLMMLAQSFMPAQEIQILANPRDLQSPWYLVKSGTLKTPEWTFTTKDLKTF
ncbi:DUF4846 domain-containing protein [Flammeovirgaceae bacterium KN852]|uniref:DUF4846 domain-containing protein n=2 Tax=Marinigracilibium pacificum TaxID=2729599 RepID=A0A848J2Q3_9BACT|nr:DUF4846 domain-containing protein [Marinigracilibium pacificum]